MCKDIFLECEFSWQGLNFKSLSYGLSGVRKQHEQVNQIKCRYSQVEWAEENKEQEIMVQLEKKKAVFPSKAHLHSIPYLSISIIMNILLSCVGIQGF